MSQTSREVCVITDFTDNSGKERGRGEVFTVAYGTEKQRQAVNRQVHRGFLTFDLSRATEYLDADANAAKGDKRRSRGA